MLGNELLIREDKKMTDLPSGKHEVLAIRRRWPEDGAQSSSSAATATWFACAVWERRLVFSQAYAGYADAPKEVWMRYSAVWVPSP